MPRSSVTSLVIVLTSSLTRHSSLRHGPVGWLGPAPGTSPGPSGPPHPPSSPRVVFSACEETCFGVVTTHPVLTSTGWCGARKPVEAWLVSVTTPKESHMSRYMFIARYDSAGVKGVVSKGGAARASVIEKVAADLGGRMATFDFAVGEDDVYTLCELPDNNGRVPRHGCELHRASPCPHRGPDE